MKEICETKNCPAAQRERPGSEANSNTDNRRLPVTTDVLNTPFQPSRQAPANGTHRPEDDDPPPATVMTITPEMAAEFMGRNVKNRKGIRADDVNKYARDIVAGAWIVNGETIKVARNGHVLDGQHRFLGCMRAGMPFRSYIVTGLPPEAQDTIDCGITRTAADQLDLHDEYQPKSLAAISRWAIRWAAGARGRSVKGTIKPSHSEIIGFVRVNPEIRDATRFGINARGRYKLVRVSVYGMAWWLFTHIDGGVYSDLSRHRAEDFLEKAVTGADVGIGNPAYSLRERFRRASPLEMDERLNEYEQLALFITAWNGWRDGKEMRRIPLPHGGLTTRNFPEPK
jgi:hypothetical protein